MVFLFFCSVCLDFPGVWFVFSSVFPWSFPCFATSQTLRRAVSLVRRGLELPSFGLLRAERAEEAPPGVIFACGYGVTTLGTGYFLGDGYLPIVIK